MTLQTYLELVADRLGLSSAKPGVLPSHAVDHAGSLFHSKIPFQLRMNLPQPDAFPAVALLSASRSHLPRRDVRIQNP